VTDLVDYTRIGSATFVQAASPQPQIAWSLINGAGIDPYTGLDPFNRVVDNRWFSTATSADLDRIQHGYDRAGNRLWRKNTVAEAAGVYLDELYAYDGVYRLARLDRGELNGTNTGIVAGTEDFTQAWGLDATGNWATFDQADTGGSWTLTQARTSNTVNEITGITGGGWVVPVYDAAGNMVTMPQPAAPTAGFAGIYDAWNRLMSLSSGGSAVGSYRFDGLNRRVSKFVSGALRDIFYTTAWQAIEERVGGSTTPDRQFVWGLRYTDDLVLRDRGTERLYGIQDPNWNLTAIVDATGVVPERYGYAAYGFPTVLTPAFALRSISSYDWETRFASYRWDSETSNYQVRHRWLETLLGCWSTRDPTFATEMPAGYAGAAIRSYQYASSNPIRFLDPHGLAPFGLGGMFNPGKVIGAFISELRQLVSSLGLPLLRGGCAGRLEVPIDLIAAALGGNPWSHCMLHCMIAASCRNGVAASRRWTWLTEWFQLRLCWSLRTIPFPPRGYTFPDRALWIRLWNRVRRDACHSAFQTADFTDDELGRKTGICCKRLPFGLGKSSVIAWSCCASGCRGTWGVGEGPGTDRPFSWIGGILLPPEE